jgi:hypothetical protein
MKQTILAAAAVLALSAPAMATEWIYCGDAADEVQIGLLAGHFQFLDISRANLRVGEEQWSTNPDLEPGTPISTGQHYGGDNQLLVDLTDVNSEEVLAELRVFTADEGDYYVQGGILRVPGRGAWVVSCEGP